MTDINPVDIRRAAMDHLARREHGFNELVIKLLKRFDDKELIEAEVQRLTDRGLQSDERFIESFIRSKVNRGYGPSRIKQDLSQKKLARELVSLIFEQLDTDWYEVAQDVYERKYKGCESDDVKEKAKRIRYLAYRGFPQSIIYDILD